LEIFNYMVLGFGYRHADAVVAVSKGVARALEQRHGVPGKMIHVVYNSVELQDDVTASEEAKHPWLAAGQPPLILGAGRLTRQKGFDTLLAAFQLVRNDRPARLVILGTGKEELSLASTSRALGIKEDVLFGGFVSDPWIWMRRADVFALSSRWEGLPGVLLQAMACGTRVVSTDCPSGPAEILEDGKWGRLVPVDDAAALARAILDSLDETDSPPVIQRAAEFNLGYMVDRYLEVLHLQIDKVQP